MTWAMACPVCREIPPVLERVIVLTVGGMRIRLSHIDADGMRHIWLSDEPVLAEV